MILTLITMKKDSPKAQAKLNLPLDVNQEELLTQYLLDITKAKD